MEAAERDAAHAAWLKRERLTEKPISVAITDTTTGETRMYSDTGFWDEAGKFQDFIWCDGNFACDCNRGQFFAEAAGENTDDLDDEAADDRFPCGHDRYVVRILDADGTEIYADAA